jgi:ppGpp synthetase/RelA/SpoT-type nucleotidyltranferase
MPSSGQDLELRAYRVHAPAQQAMRLVLFAIQSSEAEAFYAVRSRVKSVERMVEKVSIKRCHPKNPKPNYEPEDITDVVGVRVVTLFREDVIDALKIFLKMIKHEGLFSSTSPFSRGELKEAILYTTASKSDPEAITSRILSAFEAGGFPLKDGDVQETDTGYSSVHLVAFCNVTQQGKAFSLPVEIQIRTVFEDAWGEIDHKLRYSLDRLKGSSSDRLLESWKPHLNVLKNFTDGCGQYAGVIKNQAIDARGWASFDSKPFVPVEDVDDALAQLGEIPDELRKAFTLAYSMRNAASLSQRRNATEAQVSEEFVEAAAQFAKVHGLAQECKFVGNRERSCALFFSRMEEAFCLLSARTKSCIADAIAIYREMRDVSPKSVVIYYRLAQSLAALNEVDAALVMYGHAETLLSDDEHVPPRHWLRSLIPRNRGFLLWRKSETCDGKEDSRLERLVLLLEAYRCTKRSLERTPEKTTGYTRCLNNLIYYIVEYHSFLKDTDHGEIDAAEAKAFLKDFEKRVDVGTAPRSQLHWLDTLCRSYAWLERFDEAVLVAERIEHLVSGPPDEAAKSLTVSAPPGSSYFSITAHLNENERYILDHALWVLRKHGPGPEHEAGTATETGRFT